MSRFSESPAFVHDVLQPWKGDKRLVTGEVGSLQGLKGVERDGFIGKSESFISEILALMKTCNYLGPATSIGDTCTARPFG